MTGFVPSCTWFKEIHNQERVFIIFFYRGIPVIKVAGAVFL